MSYLKQLQGTMTEEKKQDAKHDLFAFYIGRPLSYILTIPFLWFNTKPNTISIIAAFEIVIAAWVLSSASSIKFAIAGWGLFFLWNLLDGVDGNIARLKKNGSKLGSVYDAMSGYEAMFLLYFSAGIFSFNMSGHIDYIQIIVGALSGMFVIFPRLIMHKTNTELGCSEKNELADKKDFGFIKVVALNITSISGLVEVFLLIAIMLNHVNIFNWIYLVINLVVMIGSLIKVLK